MNHPAALMQRFTHFVRTVLILIAIHCTIAQTFVVLHNEFPRYSGNCSIPDILLSGEEAYKPTHSRNQVTQERCEQNHLESADSQSAQARSHRDAIQSDWLTAFSHRNVVHYTHELETFICEV